MTITSRQRRANDRRRYWAAYRAFLADFRALVASTPSLHGYTVPDDSPDLRNLYRADRRLNRQQALIKRKRAARRK